MSLCLIGALLILIIRPFVSSKTTHTLANVYVERIVGKICIYTFISNQGVTINGIENLPKSNSSASSYKLAPVFIANHASQLDIGAVYFLNRTWKWIAKKAVIFLPGVGQLMYLGGHVFIDRPSNKSKNNNTNNNKKKKASSVKNLYVKSKESILKDNTSMFLFPQGTRRMGERLLFKDGAFKIAIDCQTTIIPISIEIPKCAWNTYYPLTLLPIYLKLIKSPPSTVILTVHKPISTINKTYDDIELLKKQCYDTIYSVLPNYGITTGTAAVAADDDDGHEKKKK